MRGWAFRFQLRSAAQEGTVPQHPGMSKRQKELARKEKLKEKDARRDQRKKEKAERAIQPGQEGVDPDIAGIVPGPQPPLEGY
jgi:hypothetical protein